MQDLIRAALNTTEASGIIVARATTANKIWILPSWECESTEALAKLATANAITWADEHGAGPVEVYYEFRELPIE